MEEIEAPTEALTEEIHHHAHTSKERWVSWVALSSALFAVLAAVAALISNHHANEAMLEQIQASDQWGYYQAKGIKANLVANQMELLTALGKTPSEQTAEKVARYHEEQENISEKAREKEKDSEVHLKRHVTIARGVTLFQIAIAVSAISLLVQNRRFWYLGIVLATCGAGFFIQGLLLI